jgi:hypothetical protein
MTERLIGTAEEITNRLAECEEAVAQVANVPLSAKVITQFRKQFGEDLAGVLLSVTALQSKARKKFADSDTQRVWWVTDKSLQQATAWQVAKLKSTWFGDRAVHDLCCGVGGDAMQMANRGSVIAIDADPVLAGMAGANLAGGFSAYDCQARCGDAMTVDIPADAAVHIDPDRRSQGSRSSQPDLYQPNWDQVMKIVEHVESAIVKVAPAAQIDLMQPRLDDSSETHRCWISLRGSVREQALLVGESVTLAGLPAGGTSAAIVAGDGTVARFCSAGSTQSPLRAQQPMGFMIDPDASIRAAGLTESFATEHEFHLLGSASGFLTCDNKVNSIRQLATAGRVIWSGAFDDRKLRREFRDRNVYPQTIKVRGTGHDPATLTKRFRQCGETPVTLWLGRNEARVFAAITEETMHQLDG